MSMLTCPQCGTEYPPGTIMCLNDGHEFEEAEDGQNGPVQAQVLQDDADDEAPQLPALRNGNLVHIQGAALNGPMVHIEVIHIDGSDMTPGSTVQSFPISCLGSTEIRVGRRVMDCVPPYKPEIDFYDLLKAAGQESPWPISRLQATMLLCNGVPALCHKPEFSTTWVRHSGSPRFKALRPNRTHKLKQRDVIVFGKPNKRYIALRISWDE